MGLVSGENGVLKLVHPGGFVELHKNPITAAEVMERNPRHCVTRPDVFKFPWIVVHPESVLKPGRVFYVVPYHTIHHLLRPKDFSPRPKVTSWIDAKLDIPIEEFQSRREHDLSNEIFIELNYLHQFIKRENDRESRKSTAYYSPGSEYQNKFYRNQLAESPNQKQQQQCPKDEVHDLYIDSCDEVQSLMPRYEERVELKSCLKKHCNNKITKSRGFRVRFALDHDHDHGDDIEQ